jgi:hypothetical protein
MSSCFYKFFLSNIEYLASREVDRTPVSLMNSYRTRIEVRYDLKKLIERQAEQHEANRNKKEESGLKKGLNNLVYAKDKLVDQKLKDSTSPEQPKKFSKTLQGLRNWIASTKPEYAYLAPLTNRRNHLIYSYFIESTGIVEVFRVLFRRYMTTGEVLNLNRETDQQLIETLEDAMLAVFPKPASSIVQNLEQMRYSAYWRLFGYTIKGKENNFPKVAGYNLDFNKTFESIMYNIFQGILDKGITTNKKLSDSDALAELLNNLGCQLRGRTTNEIDDLSEYWAYVLYTLVLLLEDDHLMTDRLDIRSTDPSCRLIVLGEKVGVPVAKATSYLLLLAARMNIFLRTVQDAFNWDAATAAILYEDPQNQTFFKEISSAWFQVTGRDFSAEALRARRTI